MLMHVIAHGGCADTVRESALEVDSVRKIPYHTGDSNRRQYCALAFRSDALPTPLRQMGCKSRNVLSHSVSYDRLT